MCGINGLLGSADPQQLTQQIKAMNQAIVHRGPDDSGLWLDQQHGLVLGHQRLAIVDLSAGGQQPMHSPAGRYVITFNGEIYNHTQLRQQLAQLNPALNWQGHADTETLLAAFDHWGISLTLPKLTGMFALAVWDKQTQQLTLIRDRIGEKPLYYGQVGQQFAFSSELKAFKTLTGFDKPLNRQALCAYLRLGYVPAPDSIYQGIHKLEPGCLLELSVKPGGRIQRQKQQVWWSFNATIERAQQKLILTENLALQALEQQLQTTLALQTQADVPIGAFLSGGVDSSLIVALLQKYSSTPVNTFTIGFQQPGYDEAEHARHIAAYLGTSHHEHYLSSQDAQDIIPALPDSYDEPFADSAQIPNYLMSRYAQRHVKVALSGDGGDELFGGYNSYLWSSRIWRKAAYLPQPLRNALAKLLTVVPVIYWDKLLGWMSRHTVSGSAGEQLHKLGESLHGAEQAEDLFRQLGIRWSAAEALVIGWQPTADKACGARSSIHPPPTISMQAEHLMMRYDSTHGLPDGILCKTDRAAMANSLETRIPFLDHQLIELAWRLPLPMKIRRGNGKWLLKQLLAQQLPRSLTERPKQGFNVPLAQWLRGDLRDWAETLLNEQRLKQAGYLHPRPIRQQWQALLNGQGNHQQRLWTVLMFQAWLERWENS